MTQADSADLLHTALQKGELELKGQFMPGSNYTFLVDVHYADCEYQAVYKPSKGERPLWDFPENTLALREVAAYLVSEALGFHFVPYTTLRGEEIPIYGSGSLQQYIDYDPEYHYFTFSDEDKERLRPVALFDLLVNNADRKGSHVFVEKGTNKLWAIDHGICFHEEDKLRTVIWDFAGQPIPDELCARLEVLLSGSTNLLSDLQPYLGPEEITALTRRAKKLLTTKAFPRLPRDRRVYPYPPV
jgi:uncharacterized repeat protein (TIGR03843 family)